jgi:photosystem II stability/assembly factor-like uncharacterized protein
VDAAASWKRIEKGLADTYVSAILIDPSNSNVLYAGTRQGVHKTTDGGETWGQVNEGLTTLNIRSMALSPIDPQTVFAGTNGSGLFRSADRAKTWQAVPLTPAPNPPTPTPGQ